MLLEAERKSDKVSMMGKRVIVITFIIGFLAVVYSGFSASRCNISRLVLFPSAVKSMSASGLSSLMEEQCAAGN